MNANTGYENAPATLLLATSCACCGRPLVDAVSVECGVGPDCRAKFGYGALQGDPNWDLVASLLKSTDIAISDVRDAHAVANKLVSAIARKSPHAAALVAAVRALGFNTLGDKLATKSGGIRIVSDGEALAIHAPYSADFTAEVKNIPGRRFFKEGKIAFWTVPASARKALWTALKASFPKGTAVYGSKGMNTL